MRRQLDGQAAGGHGSPGETCQQGGDGWGGAGKIGWREAGPGGRQEIMSDCSRPPLLSEDSDSRPSVLLCSWCLQGCRCIT